MLKAEKIEIITAFESGMNVMGISKSLHISVDKVRCILGEVGLDSDIVDDMAFSKVRERYGSKAIYAMSQEELIQNFREARIEIMLGCRITYMHIMFDNLMDKNIDLCVENIRLREENRQLREKLNQIKVLL